MTTPIETSQLTSVAKPPPEGELKQDVEVIDPVNITPLGGIPSTSKDTQSNDSKQESLESFLSKWRYHSTDLVETSSTGRIGVWSWNTNYFRQNCIGFPLTEQTPAVITNMHRGAYIGVRFDIEYKFTIYSSSQQQGALIFAIWPIMYSRSDRMANIFHVANTEPIYDDQGLVRALRPAELTLSDLTQLSHKVVLLGATTEIIIKLPYLSKYDFLPLAEWDEGMALSSIVCNVMEPLKVRSGTYDKVTIRTEYRFTNVKYVGPAFSNTDTLMGQYAHG